MSTPAAPKPAPKPNPEEAEPTLAEAMRRRKHNKFTRKLSEQQ